MSETAWKKTASRVNQFCQKVLPSTDAMRVEKKILRVPIKVTEYDAIVPMKGLVQKTVDRLMEDPDIKKKIKELVELNDGRPIKIQFIFKVGMDGFKNNPCFKQKLENPKSRDQGACLASVMVPLQLVTIIKKKIHLVWQNCRCNSPYACRPVRFVCLFVCLFVSSEGI